MPILNYPVGCVYTHTHTHIHIYQFSSVAQLCSTLLRHHRLQHARLPCPSPTPGAYSDSCPLSQWCHPTISSSVIPFSCLQSFPASGSFPMRLLFASGGQSIGVSASACPSDEYSELISLRMDWLDLLAVQGTLKNLLQHHSSKASILWHSAFFTIQLSHPYVTTGVKKKKNISLTRRTTYMCVCVCVCVYFPHLDPFIHWWTLRQFPVFPTVNNGVNMGAGRCALTHEGQTGAWAQSLYIVDLWEVTPSLCASVSFLLIKSNCRTLPIGWP